MSGHADTIRNVLDWPICYHNAAESDAAYKALDELVVKLREQADRIAWLEGEVAGWRIKLAECEERHGFSTP